MKKTLKGHQGKKNEGSKFQGFFFNLIRAVDLKQLFNKKNSEAQES